jgi:hypothetical protein
MFHRIHVIQENAHDAPSLLLLLRPVNVDNVMAAANQNTHHSKLMTSSMVHIVGFSSASIK